MIFEQLNPGACRTYLIGCEEARQAALVGHEVIVAEATGGIGNGVSSRNSEVIHGGMYYPTGSLRAKHCVQGRRLLYDFCNAHGVPYKKVGKLIVAVDEKQFQFPEGKPVHRPKAAVA